MIARRALHLSACRVRGRYPFFNKHRPVTDPRLQEEHYFEKAAQALSLDEEYVDNLEKLYTAKVASARELMYKAEDRLVAHDGTSWLPRVDPNSPRLAYRAVDELAEAPESVKRIFSVAYGERRDLTDVWKAAMADEVKKHALDEDSIESRIAWLTTLIRHWTLLVEDIAKTSDKKPVWLKTRLLTALDQRRKLLRQLRETDSQAFTNILNKLKISYRVPRQDQTIDPVEFTRKGWSEAQARLRVNREKEKRMALLHEAFVREREERGAEMDAEERRLKKEREDIETRLRSLDHIQGRGLHTKKRYQPALIDRISETVMNSALFSHRKPLELKKSLR